MPSGAAVLFTTGPLGASREFDLGHLVEGEERRPGDRGRVLFDHPNPKLAAEGWGYVEVESRLTPGEKLYVGVAPSMIAGSRCCVFHATGGSRMMDCGPEVHEEEASAPPAGSSSPG